MSLDLRLSSVLHMLLHLSSSKRPLSSQELAMDLGTHAVVIRRTLGSLRQRGYVRSGKGNGGGWSMACDPAAITLNDVHRALGAHSVLALGHRRETPVCTAEQAVHQALDQAFSEAENSFTDRLDRMTLAGLLTACGGSPDGLRTASSSQLPCGPG